MADGINPVLLSVLIDRYRPIVIDPCPECGADLELTEMRSGSTTYRCRNAGRDILDQTLSSVQYQVASEHYRRSSRIIANCGDPDVVTALLELRALREDRGDDMTVPEGAEYYPHGHESGHCWRRSVHAGADTWKDDNDLYYKHNPKHHKQHKN